MTPQYILRKSLCRPAHCFSAHIPGQGYIGQGANIGADTKEEYDRQRVRCALQEIECMDFATKYAEPGYTDPAKMVLMANWNVFPRGISSILERYGYAIEWSDEWAVCSNCNGAVRVQPDSWGWTPSYTIGDGELTCSDCLRASGDEDDDEPADEPADD